jgi:hypothetical protein
LILKARGIMEEIESVTEEQNGAPIPAVSAISGWTRPQVGIVKVNWDAALNKEMRRIPNPN